MRINVQLIRIFCVWRLSPSIFSVFVGLFLDISWKMFWRYDKEQLLSFRPAAPDTIRRPVRKILFRLHIWRPCRRRFRAIGTSPTPVLEPSSARSGSYANCSPTSQPRTQPCLQNSDRMTVASLNARSIRHKSASIQDIDWLIDIFAVVWNAVPKYRIHPSPSWLISPKYIYFWQKARLDICSLWVSICTRVPVQDPHISHLTVHVKGRR